MTTTYDPETNAYDPAIHGVCPWPSRVIGTTRCVCGLEVVDDPDIGWVHFVARTSDLPPTSSEVVDAIQTVRESFAGFLEDWRALGEVVRELDPASYRRVDAYISWDEPRDVGAGQTLTSWLMDLERSAVDAEDPDR